MILVVSIPQARLKHRVTKVLQVVDSIPDDEWLMEVEWEREAEMGLYLLMGTGGREVREHTGMESLFLVTLGVFGEDTNAVGSQVWKWAFKPEEVQSR